MGDTSNLVVAWRSVMMAMVCLPIIICIALLCLKKVERKASFALAATLFTAVVAITPQIIGFAGFYDVYPGLTFFPLYNDLWLGPLVYLHAHLLLRQEPLGWRKLLILPGILQTAYYTWAFLSLGDYKSKWAYSSDFHSPYIVPVESLLAILFLGLALFKIWRIYHEYKNYIYATESIAIEFEPIWLKRIIFILLVTGVLFASIEIIELFVGLTYFAAFPVQVLIMLGIAWLSIEAVGRINQPYPKLPISIDEENNPKQERNNEELEDANWQALAEKINAEVLTHKWFLEPRFSLRELASKMGTNEVYTSKAINKGMNLSFNDYINQKRVEFAQNLIRNTNLPILSIALDSGFNSKATFNRVFKDQSGLTPSQYKRQEKAVNA